MAPALVAATLGVFVGTGVVTFQHAEGLSYLSTDPRACVNCHIMRSQYDSWQKASHHNWARCVDCHLPHDFVPKYIAKARNGGTIAVVAARRADGWLELVVTNTGAPFARSDSRTATGLANTTERLALMYGPASGFALSSESAGTRVRFGVSGLEVEP